MPTLTPPPGDPALAAKRNFEKWRLIKDAIVRHGVVAGGVGVIIAVVMIFFYLLYVVLPLFLPASATQTGHYPVPEKNLGASVSMAVEEQNQIAVRFTDTGHAVFFEAATGKTVLTQAIAIPDGAKITRVAEGSPTRRGAVVYGLGNGQAVVVEPSYEVSFPGNVRVITPSLSYPVGEAPIVIDEAGGAIEQIAFAKERDVATIVAKAAGKIHIVSLAKDDSLFADEAALERTESHFDSPAEGVDFMLASKEGRSLYLASKSGRLAFYDISDKAAPSLKHAQRILPAGQTITSMVFLNGDLSLLIGDSTGKVGQWTAVRDADDRLWLRNIRSFQASSQGIGQIESEQRRRGFLTVDDHGRLGVFHSTAERTLLDKPVGGQVRMAALSPRANLALLQTGADERVQVWRIDNDHPEVSLGALWRPVWYESYPEPDFIWQSSAATSDFEPKYSLTPLVFGTLKAAFYALLVAVPLALMGAIYTAYFMAPPMRQYVKPTIEIMGALPTVILGFLAGLWLAPLVEQHLPGVFFFLLTTPLIILAYALAWQCLPKVFAERIPPGWDAALLIPAILFSGWLAFALSAPLEAWLFDGNLRAWLKATLGLDYDQRNALVVGFAMGFAVIPIIFSIAEDAIFNVPKHLTVGSLALGATPWQTMVNVVLLTASPGIFSAIMIGMGRAVGETMIVLMSTGNTPVMDISPFQGLRALAANIAVEMPESEAGGTHYRILFLSALVLFTLTFTFNTLAEVIRQRLREKYSSL